MRDKQNPALERVNRFLAIYWAPSCESAAGTSNSSLSLVDQRLGVGTGGGKASVWQLSPPAGQAPRTPQSRCELSKERYGYSTC